MQERYNGFTFRYCHDVANPGSVRIYVEDQPSYRGRSDDAHSTHRLGLDSDNGAPPYVCIKSNSLPHDIESARSLAHRWADATENYVRTGEFR